MVLTHMLMKSLGSPQVGTCHITIFYLCDIHIPLPCRRLGMKSRDNLGMAHIRRVLQWWQRTPTIHGFRRRRAVSMLERLIKNALLRYSCVRRSRFLRS
jgi:hypothetical protein